MTFYFSLSARSAALAACLVSVSPALAVSQQPGPELSPSAPKDRPVSAAQRCIWDAIEIAQQPYVMQARASWPQAKERYLAGLSPRHIFFVTALIVDSYDRREQVYIAVDSIRSGQISGRIWSQLDVVRGYRLGDPYTFPESELRDWMIANPDGSETGNFVGKFLDGYEPPAKCQHTPGS
jgi:hypothetical protein